MELVTPGIGLLFWMTVVFLSLLFLLKKFAWKPILGMLKEREVAIDNALKAAEKAKEESALIQANNEKLLDQAKKESAEMLKETRATQERIINEAKKEAQTEAQRMIAHARETIEMERQATVHELKNQVAVLSIEIAEKIIKQTLEKDNKQQELIKQWVENIKFN